MKTLPAPVLSQATAAVCFFCVLMIPCALAGLALINAGLGRSRNGAHCMFSALCVIAVAGVTYFAVGFAWQGYPGREGHVLRVAGTAWDYLGAERLFLRGVDFDGSSYSLAAMFG